MFNSFVVAFLLAFLLTPLLRWMAHRVDLLDVPNERSSHERPTPRSGGYAMLVGASSVAPFISFDESIRGIVTGAILIAVVGAIDDVVDLREWQKLLAQIAAAGLTIVIGSAVVEQLALPGVGPLPLSVLAPIITGFWLVGFTNAFNFMDGINGIASVQAIVAGLTFAALFHRSGDVPGTLLSLAVAGAAAGFFPWNLPSGSIFMGDVGSATLGFVLAGLSVRYAAAGGSFIAVLIPLLGFVLDPAVTLVRRIVAGERFFSAHRKHFYQRLNRLGWSHVQVTGVWTLLMVACSAGGLVFEEVSEAARAMILVVELGLMSVVFVAITVREHRARTEIAVDAATTSGVGDP